MFQAQPDLIQSPRILAKAMIGSSCKFDLLTEIGRQFDLQPARQCSFPGNEVPYLAEAAGVSLQLSGHTHLGQFIPWSWMARRVYRQFVYGLSRIGAMQVFTSSGAGTWGPPLRLGSNPEIVMLEFQ